MGHEQVSTTHPDHYTHDTRDHADLPVSQVICRLRVGSERDWRPVRD
jgi:hypothetical protein